MKHQTKDLLKLREDARCHHAQLDRLINEMDLLLTTLEVAQRVFTEAMAEKFPVVVLPAAKKA